jgi:hypothetical protein
MKSEIPRNREEVFNMNGSTSLNGTKLLWWIIGTLTTVMMGVGAGTFATLRNNSERIAVLESQLTDTRHQLQRIEQKLDHLLEVDRER